MKIISWNVNGIRAVHRKGFFDWFQKEKADIVCLQEIKAHQGQIPAELIAPKGYYGYFNPAQRKGYSGTAVYTKNKPLSVENKIGLDRFDEEGRVLKLEFSDFILFNFYIPYGGREKENLDYKLQVYKHLLKYLKRLKGKKIILMGDFNIAHEEIDLAHPKQNKNNIMFTAIEREQIDKLIELGFVDTFRHLHKESGHYSWWSYMRQAREKDIGWRIDYLFISNNFIKNLKKAFIRKAVTGSDHCPVGVVLTVNC